MKNDQIAKGDRVKDTITGYQGLVVCVADWINGCLRLGVYPEPGEIVMSDDTGGPRDDPK